MNTFDAYYAKQTPGNACRLAATDHRVQGMCNFDFVADLNKAGELADQHADMLAMLERMDNELCELRDRCRSVSMPEDSYDEIDPDSIFPNVLREARALLAKIKGE